MGIFSRPLIESTFNIMDDIIEKDKMTITNYEPVAVVKTILGKKNVKSTDLKLTNAMKKLCISAYVAKIANYLVINNNFMAT